ncbi:hypothetical protein D3C84_790930 [compost metagenome]
MIDDSFSNLQPLSFASSIAAYNNTDAAAVALLVFLKLILMRVCLDSLILFINVRVFLTISWDADISSSALYKHICSGAICTENIFFFLAIF